MHPLRVFGLALLGGILALAPGCSRPSSDSRDAELVTVTVAVKTSKGRPVELDSISLMTPAGEGVGGDLPPNQIITTRAPPGPHKLGRIPASTSPAAAKLVTEAHQDPQQTPWEITVSTTGGSFDLTVD